MPQRPGDPFTDLGLLQREVNTLFERLLSSERGEGADGQWSPPVDVYECRGKLLVVVEVAGIGPDSLRVVHRNGDGPAGASRAASHSTARSTWRPPRPCSRAGC
jgi:HSP20 family molecular chaperone IbpA